MERPDDLVLHTLDGGLAIRIGDGRLSRTKLRALFTVLDQISDLAQVRYVDLRFHNQVIVKEG